MQYRIREYEHSDLSSLAAIYSAAVRHLGERCYSRQQVAAWSGQADDRQQFKQWIDTATTFVAVTQDNICIGFGGLDDSGHITSLYVSPEVMRRRVASTLLEHLLEVASSRNLERVTTTASEFSRPVFENYGFSVTGIEPVNVKGVDFNRYKMERL